jgi:hypothetical protein
MKLSLNGPIALTLLALGWLSLLVDGHHREAIGGMLMLSVIAGAMVFLMR